MLHTWPIIISTGAMIKLRAMRTKADRQKWGSDTDEMIKRAAMRTVRCHALSQSSTGAMVKRCAIRTAYAVSMVMALLSAPLAVRADNIELSLPIDCNIGTYCYVQTLKDASPSSGVSDFRGLHMARDGHKGTDFAMLSIAQLDTNVAVYAAAPGVVRGMRDGMADVIHTPENAANIAGRECGNGVVIAHASGWETQYCHLKAGSITVTPGQVVGRKDFIGYVGLSGETSFPHLHFEVRKNNKSVDPFDPDHTSGPSTQNATLWKSPPPLTTGGIIRSGAAITLPILSKVRKGEYTNTQFAANSPSVIVWTYIYQVQPDDRVFVRITGPNGFKHETTTVIDSHKERYMIYSGKKRRQKLWATGFYTGEIILKRDGKDLATDTILFKIK